MMMGRVRLSVREIFGEGRYGRDRVDPRVVRELAAEDDVDEKKVSGEVRLERQLVREDASATPSPVGREHVCVALRAFHTLVLAAHPRKFVKSPTNQLIRKGSARPEKKRSQLSLGSSARSFRDFVLPSSPSTEPRLKFS